MSWPRVISPLSSEEDSASNNNKLTYTLDTGTDRRLNWPIVAVTLDDIDLKRSCKPKKTSERPTFTVHNPDSSVLDVNESLDSSSDVYYTPDQTMDDNFNRQLTDVCESLKSLSIEDDPVRLAIPAAITAAKVLQSNPRCLTPYEKIEILRYRHIYYFGQMAKKRPGVVGIFNNSLYDDSKGFYRPVVHDHIAYRYETLNQLGKGSFGCVLRAFDHKRRKFVAIKIIANKIPHSVMAEREVRLMHYLTTKDKADKMNVVHLNKCLNFRNHTCLVIELMSLSLRRLISKNEKKGFSLQLARKFTFSIVRSLEFLSTYKIMHGDLKPENLLKRRGSSGLKLSDFGLSKRVEPGDFCFDSRMQTRWYRAPEVLLGYPYDLTIDMWSLGCVVAELITGHALLQGENESDQLALIIELLGLPPPHIIQKSTRKSIFFKSDGSPSYFNVTDKVERRFIAGRTDKGKLRGYPGTRRLVSAIGDDDPNLIDFLRRCLTWNPARRMTPRAALNHPWLRQKRDSRPPGMDNQPVPFRLRTSFDFKATVPTQIRLTRNTGPEISIPDWKILNTSELNDHYFTDTLNSGF